jgi:hypothetical protein
MRIVNFTSLISLLLATIVLVGCESIPPEQLKNYGLIESRIGLHGMDMDTLPYNSLESVAYITYIDGRPKSGGPSINIAPGEYQFQVGLGCNSTVTCRPGAPYKINVEAGKRYVLRPNGVYVSDRFSSRKGEVLYR